MRLRPSGRAPATRRSRTSTATREMRSGAVRRRACTRQWASLRARQPQRPRSSRADRGRRAAYRARCSPWSAASERTAWPRTRPGPARTSSTARLRVPCPRPTRRYPARGALRGRGPAALGAQPCPPASARRTLREHARAAPRASAPAPAASPAGAWSSQCAPLPPRNQAAGRARGPRPCSLCSLVLWVVAVVGVVGRGRAVPRSLLLRRCCLANRPSLSVGCRCCVVAASFGCFAVCVLGRIT